MIDTVYPRAKYLAKSRGQFVHHGDYSLAYSEEHEQAYWVSYELTKDEVLGSTKRKDSFRPDPKIKTGSASLADYKNSGFDRGHLKPAADSKEDSLEMSESFYMSNISPQNQSFNRRIWKDLEELVRSWAINEDTILVITGPVLSKSKWGDLKEPFKKIGENNVSIPKYYYKVIVDITGEKKGIGFLLPNKASSEPLQNYVLAIDRIEEITNIDFFASMADGDENKLERHSNVSLWDFKPVNIDKYRNSAPKVKVTKEVNNIPKDGVDYPFSVNKNSGVRHNKNCKAFNCKNCVPTTDRSKGRPCGNCGG